MRIKNNFVLREIGDTYYVVPLYADADRICGIIRLSSSGAFLWKLLQSEQTEESLADALTAEYAVDAATARADVAAFLASLRSIGCLEE